MTRNATTVLVVTIGAGVLACLLGIATAMSYANHLMSLGSGDARATVWPATVAEVNGRAIAVLALALACAISTTIAVIAFVTRHAAGARWLVVAGAVLHVLAGALILATAWKPGWYYILDPVSSTPARPFVTAVGLQAIGWLVASVLAMRAKPA
jgi:hypothetical protein